MSQNPGAAHYQKNADVSLEVFTASNDNFVLELFEL